ncbi:hypothetical protein BGZ65_003102 [Modicella reniformis]|uniref:RRM domain-containing protein n=1 Tax=Modicella reniformis TaxID=1440133 RepID=A0A9P6MHR0_9FUNG|nr:hypothetical protein BGZ65_003102 [Modicella reniformis]
MGEKLTKKQKKSNEFRGKKRKLDESIADIPEEDTPETETATSSIDNDNKQKQSKSKSSKKNTHGSGGKGHQDGASTEDTTAVTEEETTDKKKRRREKGPSKEENKDASIEESQDEGAITSAPKNQKFIVFVGNLPYNITKEQLEKHFASCGQISSVRVQTDKATGKGKGFAFMEFPDTESMQKALFFNKTLIKERPINVELTAGGGGNKSATRKQKIVEKNQALNEERRKLHEKHIAPAKEIKSSYAASNPPAQKAEPKKNIKKPSDISGVNAIAVEGLTVRLRKA